MLSLVVHDSDEVKSVFIGKTKDEILEKVKISKYWRDITSRFTELTDGEKDENSITLDDISTELYHDGDSQDGYTLLNSI